MNAQDTPAPRTLKIGQISVGLIGLEQAMSKALETALPEEEAKDFLFAAVADKNYIPATAVSAYREALLGEYLRRRGSSSSEPSCLSVRVLGSSCVTCKALSALVFEMLQKNNLAADMESVHDLDEIWRFGVTKIPALIINGKIKCAGRMPSPVEIHHWLREENGPGVGKPRI